MPKKKLPMPTGGTDIITRDISLSIIENTAVKAIKDHDFDSDMGSGNLFILDTVFRPITFFKDRLQRKLEIDDILAVWDLFLKLCREVNKYKSFSPTINTFCNFLNISRDTFTAICNENTDRGELCRFIKDTLADRFMQLMLDNKLPQIPAIFVAKANFGMRDSDAPVTNIVMHEERMTVAEILEDFKKG